MQEHPPCTRSGMGVMIDLQQAVRCSGMLSLAANQTALPHLFCYQAASGSSQRRQHRPSLPCVWREQGAMRRLRDSLGRG